MVVLEVMQATAEMAILALLLQLPAALVAVVVAVAVIVAAVRIRVLWLKMAGMEAA